jgi:hypothetical protein
MGPPLTGNAFVEWIDIDPVRITLILPGCHDRRCLSLAFPENSVLRYFLFA